jgi:hypothetical protein
MAIPIIEITHLKNCCGEFDAIKLTDVGLTGHPSGLAQMIMSSPNFVANSL